MIDVLGDDGREKTLRGPGPRGGVGDLGPQVARQVGVDHGDLGAEAARVQRIEGRLDLVLHREEDEHSTSPGTSGCVMRIYNVITAAAST